MHPKAKAKRDKLCAEIYELVKANRGITAAKLASLTGVSSGHIQLVIKTIPGVRTLSDNKGGWARTYCVR